MKLSLNPSGLWHGVLRMGRRDHEPRAGEVCPDLQSQVELAHREWQAAQQYFQSVSEPQLVDFAVHSLIAAEQKYMFLFRKLRCGQGTAESPVQG